MHTFHQSVPQPPYLGGSFNLAWVQHLRNLVRFGQPAAPRGLDTFELLHHSFGFRADEVVLTLPERELNYSLMAGEALWTLAGSDAVAPMARLSSRMAQYSDDDKTFFGAYGPPIMAQLDYVEATLLKDPLSRQAVVEIWRRNPPETKNVPCTVALVFSMRQHRLNCHMLLRASDVWLGLPYDVFTVVAVMGTLLARLNTKLPERGSRPFGLGTVFVYAATTHFYAEHREQVMNLLDAYQPASESKGARVPVPVRLRESGLLQGNFSEIELDLLNCRDQHLTTEPRQWTIRPEWSRLALLRKASGEATS